MRRNAPPVSPLSPEHVDHTQINSSSPNLTLEQSRTQIDPFYRHVSKLLSYGMVQFISVDDINFPG